MVWASLWIILLQMYGFVIPSVYNLSSKYFKQRKIKYLTLHMIMKKCNLIANDNGLEVESNA